MINNQKFWLGLGTLSVLGFFVLLGYSIFYLNVDSTVINVVPPASVMGDVGDKDDVVSKKIKKCSGCERRAIDGVYVKSSERNLFPYAVVIDNNVNSRPQHGVGSANVVYEVEAEGGITRFFAIFADGAGIDQIGPVRSVRPYFIDIANEYSALIAHVGGSPQALARIMKDGIFNINEFYNETFFWRDNTRSAPYNVYTSSEKLDEYLSNKESRSGSFLTWKFKDEDPVLLASITPHDGVKIDYDANGYDVDWRYDKSSNEYVRYMADEKYLDADDGEIRVKNVLVQYVGMNVFDNEGRINVDLVGEGEGLLCVDGGCDAINWVKKTPGKRTRFYNFSEEVEFNAGKIWINIVRPSYEVTY